MTANRVLELQDRSFGSVALVERTLDLAFNRLRLGKDASADVIEQVVDVVGSGAVDEAIKAWAPPAETTQFKRRFDEQQEFSYAAWKKRHDVDA